MTYTYPQSEWSGSYVSAVSRDRRSGLHSLLFNLLFLMRETILSPSSYISCLQIDNNETFVKGIETQREKKKKKNNSKQQSIIIYTRICESYSIPLCFPSFLTDLGSILQPQTVNDLSNAKGQGRKASDLKRKNIQLKKTDNQVFEKIY